MNKKLANLLFPHVTLTKEDLERLYPSRGENVVCTRLAPSPTGFLHIGGVYTALINRKLASQAKNGVFMLRLEDTDKKREVLGSRKIITNVFHHLGIEINEGIISEDEEIGAYGTYVQSNRVHIYHALAKFLVEKGMAYPCFATEEELASIRKSQEEAGVTPGYYGEYAKYRDASYEEIVEKLSQNIPYVLRFKVPSDAPLRVGINDLIKGYIEMDNNFNDFVLLKTDGIPTYHFAHACDDHLMHTSHVIRGDEWVSSLPIHVQLFNALEFELPAYAHVAPVMKQDGDSRRKLSKRKDPESNAEFYIEMGYPTKALYVYLYTLINSNFEEWYLHNKDKDLSEFEVKFENMGVSGPLYDLEKLNSISSEIIYETPLEENVRLLLEWAKANDESLYDLFNSNLDFVRSIFKTQGPDSRERRKDLRSYSEFMPTFGFLFKNVFEESSKTELEEFTARVGEDRIKMVSNAYVNYFEEIQNGSEKTLKDLAKELGYTDKKKYNKNPDMYIGLFTEFYQILNLALSHKLNCIGVDDVIQVLGYGEVINRLKKVL